MAKGNTDLELLIKMMGQTTNDNDHIALAAVRKANEQVKKLTGTWAELLRGHFTIAADPFEGLSAPSFDGESRSAPASTWRRGTVTPPPPPPPQAPPPPPRRPNIQPDINAGASSPMGTSPISKYNKFRQVCHLCGQWCDAGMGLLDGQVQLTGKWRVKCIDTFKCQQVSAAKTKSRKVGSKSAKASLDNLDNILGS